MISFCAFMLFLNREREAPLTLPPDFIELMKIVRQQGLSQQGYKVRGANATSVPRKIKSLSCMRNGIAGGDAPEDDLVPMDPYRPQSGEDPPPICLPSESASQQGAPERLLRGHGESGHRRPPPCLLSQRALEEEMGAVL